MLAERTPFRVSNVVSVTVRTNDVIALRYKAEQWNLYIPRMFAEYTMPIPKVYTTAIIKVPV
jgi:hypothetical protein